MAQPDSNHAFHPASIQELQVGRMPVFGPAPTAEARSECIRMGARIVAHDVKGILSGLLLHLNRLHHQPHATPNHLPLAITTLQGLMQRVDFLVRQCLEAEGNMLAQRRWVGLRELVDSAFIAFEAKAEHAQISLVNDIAPSITVITDPQMLAMVITNMVDNSLKYCPPGSSVRVHMGQDGSLCIEDDGPGPNWHPSMSRRPDYWPRWDDRSYGIGLQTVQEICELLGDQVELFAGHHVGTRHVIHFRRQYIEALFVRTQPMQAPELGHMQLSPEDIQNLHHRTSHLQGDWFIPAPPGTHRADMVIMDTTTISARDMANLAGLLASIPGLKSPPLVLLHVSPDQEEAAHAITDRIVFVHRRGEPFSDLYDELALVCPCPPRKRLRATER